MISMLENSNLSEHDSFTDMLWSVFHLADELQNRGAPEYLTEDDLQHMAADILRAYKMLIVEWVYYIKYLKNEYPYLYNSAVKKSSFNQVTQ